MSVSKHRIIALINKKAQAYIECLGISGTLIFRVVETTDSRVKDLKVKGLRGLSVISLNGNATVYIFNDQATSLREAEDTLLHELFHVLLWPLVKNKKISGHVEERIVLGLEDLFSRVRKRR